MAVKKDLYDQFMVMSVVQDVALALVFGRVALGMSLFDYAGLIISRIEYDFGRTVIGSLASNADFSEIAITGSDKIADLDIGRPEVYDRVAINIGTSGVPAVVFPIEKPMVHDFSNMQGGGLLIPAQDLFIASLNGGYTAGGTASARVYYRVKELSAADFIELVQRLRVLST